MWRLIWSPIIFGPCVPEFFPEPSEIVVERSNKPGWVAMKEEGWVVEASRKEEWVVEEETKNQKKVFFFFFNILFD